MFLLNWLLNSLALMVTTWLVPGIHLDSYGVALIAVIVIGLVNLIVKPIMVILTLPITIITLFLFVFVINALCFWLASNLMSGFIIDGFWYALLGSLVYSLCSSILTSLTSD